VRFVPGLATLAVAAWVLLISGVGARDVAAFAGYVGLGLTLPGTLLWRAMAPRGRWRIEELALGTALGYAVETLIRIGTSAAGMPTLTTAWPIPVVLAFGLIPRLRRHWRSGADPVPYGAAWAYAAIVSGLVLWLAYSYFRTQGVTWADGSYPMGDLVFVLALAGDVANHWPPQFPYVLGEPLHYHWFFGAHLAQAGTATGIELPTLLFRLVLVPMLAVLVVSTGALADRIGGGFCRRPSAAIGPLAGLLGWVVTEVTLEKLSETVQDAWMAPVGNLMGSILWWSPTQTFSTVLLVPAALLAIELVRGRDTRRPAVWVALALLVAACSGAKGSALPVLIAGAGLVVATGLLWPPDRPGIRVGRLNLPALGVLGLASAGYLVASRFVYDGQSYGTEFDPLGMADISSLASAFSGLWLVDPGFGRSLFITVLGVLTFLAPMLGWFGLLGRRTRRDPAVALTGGAGLLGFVAMVLLYHPGQSQLYFIRSALPLLAAGAAAAVGYLVAGAGRRRVAAVLAAAFALGLAGCAAVAWRSGTQLLPPEPGLDIPGAARPYLLTLAVLVALGLVLAVAGRWGAAAGRSRPVSLLAIAALVLAGAGGVRVVGQVTDAGRLLATGAVLVPEVPAGNEQRGARWLRDNSGVDDVFLTNVQCINKGDPLGDRTCSNLAYWVSAYSERRSVLNGWGYTATNARRAAERPIRSYVHDVSFWDQQRLRRCLEFVARPTAAEAAALRADYRVRWVFADSAYGTVSAALGTVGIERFRAGTVTVYELPS
jgi:hypothetical protein